MKSWIFISVLIISASCSDNKLPKYTELSNLRILALVATSPEIDAGGSSTITPIVSDVTETSALSYEATGCIPITSADTSCSGNSTAISIQSGSLNTGDMTSAKRFTGEAASFAITAPVSALIFNLRSTQDQFNGVPYLISYVLRNSQGSRVQGYRRLIISNRATANKNSNPVLSDILANGQALGTSLPANVPTSYTPAFASNSVDTFQVMTSSGDLRTETEELVTTWFSTDGSFKFSRTVSGNETIYTPPETLPSGKDLILIAVSRDGRGGTSYKRKCFGNCN